jgi:hypothetical protein
LFRLALALGRSVAELENGPRALSARELDEWLIFWQLEPWGPIRDNMHAGLIASTIANVNRRKGSAPIRFSEFMLLDRESEQARRRSAFVGWLKRAAKAKGGG